MSLVYVPKSSKDFFEANVSRVLSSGSLAEGEWNKKLAQLVSETTHIPYAIPVASNGLGLQALLSYYRDIYNKKYVIIQDNTFIGQKLLAQNLGYVVVPDIKCNSYTLMPTIDNVIVSLQKLERLLKDSVVIVTHIGGHVCPDIPEIAKQLAELEVPLIEDCAHSMYSTLNHRHTGSWGTAGVYSVYATKSFPAGEGGVVVTLDEAIYRYVTRYMLYDRLSEHEDKLRSGVNIRISEIQALFTYSVLLFREEILDNKRSIAQRYMNIVPATQTQNFYILLSSKDRYSTTQNFYKFVIYGDHKITGRTSGVFDYKIDRSLLPIPHTCLPIWYNQDESITRAVEQELKAIYNV